MIKKIEEKLEAERGTVPQETVQQSNSQQNKNKARPVRNKIRTKYLSTYVVSDQQLQMFVSCSIDMINKNNYGSMPTWS